MPHFLNAHERYGLFIDGLTPDSEKHDVFSDIEPYTGSPLRGGKKLQFNMILERVENISKFKSFKCFRNVFYKSNISAISKNYVIPRLFPILWVDEGIELNDEMVDLIKGDLTNVLNLVSILQWTIVGVGAALFVAMLAWFFVARSKKSKASTDINTPAKY